MKRFNIAEFLFRLSSVLSYKTERRVGTASEKRYRQLYKHSSGDFYRQHSSLSSTIMVYCVAIILFVIPFFWLKPGFVNLGGDGGRLYFLDPLSIVQSSLNYSNSAYGYSFSYIPYLYFLYGLLQFLRTPTNLIAFEYGINLALGFLYIVYIVRELVSKDADKHTNTSSNIVGLVAGLGYIGMIAKTGWPVALPTINQIFLNVLIFYHLLRYCLTGKFRHLIIISSVTLLYSINFGLGNAPQLLSFYPLSVVFILLYIRYVLQRAVLWKRLLVFFFLLIGLHSFHIVPIIMSLFNTSSIVHSQVFSESVIKNAGLFYFTQNHVGSGKISRELFQWWLQKDISIYIIPLTVIGGFLVHKSRLLLLLGVMFLGTLFLVSANITHIGVALYTALFHIPGFSMFRSFNEKWFYVFAFYYVITFGVSLYYLLYKKHVWIMTTVCVLIFSVFVYRIFPFLKGDFINTNLYMSDNVSSVFTIDPTLLDTLTFIKTLPFDGKVVTFPLTFPYFQISYGNEGGAYEGISMISHIANRQDFSGFWTFGPYETYVIDAIRTKDINLLTQLFSLLNIRYIFRNADERIMDRFPKYPYVPIKTFESKDDIPAIKDQKAYDELVSILPGKKIYTNGYYSLYELDSSVIRPLIYSPDGIIGAKDPKKLPSYSSAFIDGIYCKKVLCDTPLYEKTTITYTKISETTFDFTADISDTDSPFLLVFSQPYISDAVIKIDGDTSGESIDHILVNGYANGWIIDPKRYGATRTLNGKIYLRSQNNFYIGIAISVLTGVSLCIMVIYMHKKNNL